MDVLSVAFGSAPPRRTKHGQELGRGYDSRIPIQLRKSEADDVAVTDRERDGDDDDALNDQRLPSTVRRESTLAWPPSTGNHIDVPPENMTISRSCGADDPESSPAGDQGSFLGCPTQDLRHSDLLPELGSGTTSLSQLCAANSTPLAGSQHSCRATGDGQRCWSLGCQHGTLQGEYPPEDPPEAVAWVRKKCQREKITPATITRDTRKRKARGRRRRPLTGDTAPP